MWDGVKNKFFTCKFVLMAQIRRFIKNGGWCEK